MLIERYEPKFDREAFDRLPLGTVLTGKELTEMNLSPFFFARTVGGAKDVNCIHTYTKVR